MSIGHELEKLWGRDCRENNQRRHTEFHSLRCYDSSLILIVDFPSGEEFIYIKSTTYSSLLVLLLFWELHPRAICCWKKTKHVGLHLHLLLLQLELSLLLKFLTSSCFASKESHSFLWFSFALFLASIRSVISLLRDIMSLAASVGDTQLTAAFLLFPPLNWPISSADNAYSDAFLRSLPSPCPVLWKRPNLCWPCLYSLQPPNSIQTVPHVPIEAPLQFLHRHNRIALMLVCQSCV